jgi:hypothetical protein
MRSQGSRSQGVQEGDLEDFQPETRRSAWNTTMVSQLKFTTGFLR